MARVGLRRVQGAYGLTLKPPRFRARTAEDPVFLCIWVSPTLGWCYLQTGRVGAQLLERGIGRETTFLSP